MAPVSTRSKGKANAKGSRYETADLDDDFYGMRELQHQLASLSLQLKDTVGDGNCLFRALSDQYTGSDHEHVKLRAEVCAYITENAEHFSSFLDDETVEAHVAQMKRNGTYGGNVELVAFARMKKVDLRIYQPGFVFVIEGVDVKKEGSTPGTRPVLHVAYHSWEHYSSIRNVDGPHDGLPMIAPKETTVAPLSKLGPGDPPRKIEKDIMKISGTEDLAVIRKLMEKYKGDLNSVINDLAEMSFAEVNTLENDSDELKVEAEATVKHNKVDQSAEKLDHLQTSVSSLEFTTVAAIINTTQDNETSSRSATLSTAPEKLTKRRLSSTEKKALAKRNQKLNKKNRGKDPLADSSNSPQSAKAQAKLNNPGSMKELFV